MLTVRRFSDGEERGETAKGTWPEIGANFGANDSAKHLLLMFQRVVLKSDRRQ